MTVITGEITEEEKVYINELKERLNDVIDKNMADDDHLFKRYIRARNYNVNAAENMLRKHLNWRKANHVDTILEDYIAKEGVEFVGLNFIGFDKEESLIIYNPIGNLDYKGILKSARKSEITQFMIHHFEHAICKMHHNNAKTGKHVDTFSYIFNFENFSIFSATHKPTLDLLASFITMYDINYPERLKTCICINASLSFTLYFAVMKPFLTGNTVQKVKVFGKDGWKEELLKMIDADVLPAFLGGTRIDPDGNPLCKTFISHAGKVPEKLYVNRNSLGVSLLNGKKIVIPRKTKAEIKLEVLYPGSTLEYEFETKTRDIGFCLIYKETINAEPKEIVPKQRMETGSAPESRMFRCEKSGIYILEFDNSYSWWRQKEVYYRASVVLPHNSSRRDSNSISIHK